MTESRLQRARKIIESNKYITVATTSKDGKPWNSPLGYSYDEELNIYWFSDKESQHSHNVRENENVFIVIYDSTVSQDAKSLYLEAKASKTESLGEIRKALQASGAPSTDAPEDFTDDAVRRVYRAVPQRAWINDIQIKDGRFIRDFRIEIPLETLRESLKQQ